MISNSISAAKFNNIVVTLLLFFMFLDYGGFGFVFGAMLFVYMVLFCQIIRLIDKGFVCILLMSISYCFVWHFHYESMLASQLIVMLIQFPTAYLAGNYISKNNPPKTLVDIIFIFSLGCALVYILSVMKDISVSGFLTVHRNISIIGYDFEERAATGIVSALMPLCSFILVLFVMMPSHRKMWYVLSGLLALVACVRIQSRTAIVCLAVVCVLSIILMWKDVRKHKGVLLLSVMILSLSIWYVLNNFSDQLAVIERFEEENTSTGGGRFELMKLVLVELPSHMGGGLKAMKYAHNLWIDCFRVSGALPFIFLVFYTIGFIKNMVRLRKNTSLPAYCVYVFVIIGVTLFVYMNTEPILEGAPILFSYYCCIGGFIKGLLEKRDIKRSSYVHF